ncbi:PhoH family protein [Candidatus Saccharibacteria bacterium]|nr:PhoH family protein [Candidatus Saccharibacteria bacterium]
MSKGQPIYVLDTNVIIDYVDVIPGEDGRPPVEPTIDLSDAHIVIPSVVVRELSNFKNEKTDRGKAARTALRRLRKLAEYNFCTMKESYLMDAEIEPISCLKEDTEVSMEVLKEAFDSKQLISILPVHKNFRKALPFHPSDSDMDGQIILTALTVGLLQHDLPIDGTAEVEKVWDTYLNDIVLVTNDNGLAVRARERGIRTERYGYKYPEHYTGRRDIVVPKDLFLEFYNTGEITLEIWEELMPNEPKLIANEFIVMRLENESDYPNDYDSGNDPYFLNIGRYEAREEAIVRLKYSRSFPVCLYNAGQAIYAEALMDPNISAVVCTGPAGSGKTYMAAVYGFQACKDGDFIGVTVVPCDSRSKLGALPGDLDEKMDPDVQPLKNALRNYLLNEDPKLKKELATLRKFGTGAEAKKKAKCQGCDDEVAEKRSIKAKLADRVDLIWNNWFSNIPIEHARGRDFSHELAIYDEFQDQNISQADTLIKRLGTDGKIIITGDIEQIHAPYIDSTSSGLVYASRMLMDSPLVAQVCFTEDEVIRHPLVKMVAMRQKSTK